MTMFSWSGRVAHAGLLAAVGVVLLGFLLSRAALVQAAGEVTDCSNDSELDAKLAGAGSVTFNCGGTHATATITVSSTKNIIFDTTIDGGGLVTLSGGDARRVLKVWAGATLTVTNLTVSNGFIANDYGGGIRNSGVLIVNNSRVVNSRTNGNGFNSGGGGISSEGTLTVTNSVISGNASSLGGGINSNNRMSIINSQIWGNTADESGGGVFIFVGGKVSISGGAIFSNTTFSNTTTISSPGGGAGIYNVDTLSLDHVNVVSNTTGSGAYIDGGGILNTASGTMTLTSITLSANRASNGGGIDNEGTATLNASTLSGNSSGRDGGAIYNGGNSTATLNNSTLSANSASIGGGIYNLGTTTLTNSTLSGNSASTYGGGIDNEGTATLNASTLSGNSASTYGGGISNFDTATLNNSTLNGNSAGTFGGGIFNNRTATLNNSTLSGNSAGSGGGIYNNKDVGLLNVTLSNNSATTGGALFMVGGHTTVLTNTILAYSPAGGNCNGTITASKFTFSSDNSCALPAANKIHNQDPNGLDPLLTALGNYGGPTLVHMLKLGSPAIDGVVGNDAPLMDQRGLPRPGPDGSYDIGAVERQLTDSDLAPRLFLPLIKR